MLFYDTCALLSLEDKIFETYFVISSITLQELENIKTSNTKDEEIKYKARKITRLLNSNLDKYDVYVFNNHIIDVLDTFNLPINNDNIIAASAYLCCFYKFYENEDIIFCTDDLCIKNIANKIFKLKVKSTFDNQKESSYLGYKDVSLTEEEMSYFYEHLNENIYNCLINEYLLIRDSENSVVDKRKWNGKEYISINFKPFKSNFFETVKPLDEVQMCCFDSILNNQITIIYGKAGTGKTKLALSYLIQELENQKVSKLYIVYHYETLKNAKTLGFEKGSHTEKLLNTSSLGNILSTKFGDYDYVKSLLGNKIEIIPTCNIRGVELGENDAVFVTECQNIDQYTLKTIIQRCKDGCKQIYEGDMLEQSDVNLSVNGMQKMLDVFKGYYKFGCIKLKNNYRSEICELADRM